MDIVAILVFVGIAFVVGLMVTLVVAFVSGARDAHRTHSMWNRKDPDEPA